MYPGLIDTHHHFFQAFVRNLVTIDRPNLSVMEWLAEAQNTFQMVDSDVIYYASLAAMADLIKHGCTTAFDHQYLYTERTGKEPIDRQMEAAALLGMRHRVAVVDGLPEITRELKGIGRNLNQLTVLANMGRIAEVNLGEATTALAALYNSVQALAQQEER